MPKKINKVSQSLIVKLLRLMLGPLMFNILHVNKPLIIFLVIRFGWEYKRKGLLLLNVNFIWCGSIICAAISSQFCNEIANAFWFSWVIKQLFHGCLAE